MHDPMATAQEAFRRGFTPIALKPGSKRPVSTGWTDTHYESSEAVGSAFRSAQSMFLDQEVNVGVLLGHAHGHLVDVDVDHPLAARIAMNLLPHTPMRHGRDGNPRSHYWYLASGDDPTMGGHDPGLVAYHLPSRATIIEYRASGGHTVVPESMHPDGDVYRWEGMPWGGDAGPATVDAAQLHVTVALIALIVLLADGWPAAGGRHEAYLALAGALMRDSTPEGLPRVMDLWDKNFPSLVQVLAELTHDGDGAVARISETIGTTRRRILQGKKVSGWPTLAQSIGEDHVEQARVFLKDIEGPIGEKRLGVGDYGPQQAPTVSTQATTPPAPFESGTGEPRTDETHSGIAERDPLRERVNSWQPVDLGLVLYLGLKRPEPTLLRRTDGKALLYPGRVSMLYGSGGSGKTFVALYLAEEVLSNGGRVMMIDFEDEPNGTLSRMLLLNSDTERLRDGSFTYICPDEPVHPVVHDRWGGVVDSPQARAARAQLEDALKRANPDLVIVDGVTSLYSINGLDTNDATSTDVVGRWLRSMSNGNRRTTLLIDHTSKTASPGSTPIGSQHKIAMVQGAAIQMHTTVSPVPGGIGRARLFVTKDRPGGVMQNATSTDPHCVAEVVIDSTDPEHLEITLDPPDKNIVSIPAAAPKKRGRPKGSPNKSTAAKKAAPATPSRGRGRPPKDHSVLMGRVVEALRDLGGAGSKPDISQRLKDSAVDFSVWDLTTSLRELTDTGKIVKTGQTRNQIYTIPD